MEAAVGRPPNTETTAERRSVKQAQEIRQLRIELAELRLRFQRMVKDPKMASNHSLDVQVALATAAAERKLSIDDLIYRLVNVVATDNLFAAVLDN